MNLYFFIRIGCLISTLIAFIYGIIILKKKAVPNYFKCVLLGIAGQLLASIYYFALETDDSLQSLFTLGIFGEVSSYLFIFAANIKLIPQNKKKDGFSIIGLFGAIISILILIFSIYINPSLDTIVSAALMFISAPLCIYSCLKVIRNKTKNKYNKQVKFFNIVFLILTLLSCVIQLLLSIKVQGSYTNAFKPIAIICYALWMICGLSSMFILKRGVDKWDN